MNFSFLAIFFILSACAHLLVLYLYRNIRVKLLRLFDCIINVAEEMRLNCQLHELFCQPLNLEIISFMIGLQGFLKFRELLLAFKAYFYSHPRSLNRYHFL